MKFNFLKQYNKVIKNLNDEKEENINKLVFGYSKECQAHIFQL